MPTTYTPRHADVDPTEREHYRYDPDDPRERFEMEEVREVLSAMPCDPDHLGDGGPDDWTLAILFALAGVGDSDAHLYIAPRVEAAALSILADLGYPGPGFEGA